SRSSSSGISYPRKGRDGWQSSHPGCGLCFWFHCTGYLSVPSRSADFGRPKVDYFSIDLVDSYIDFTVGYIWPAFFQPFHDCGLRRQGNALLHGLKANILATMEDNVDA